MSDLLKQYPEIASAALQFEIPVLWGDMDSARHVNNLIYLKWIETSRILLFEKIMDTSFMGKQGPILGWQDCKYIFPMTFPDRAIITATVKEIRTDRFFVESRVYSKTKSRIAAISVQSVVPYDYIELKKIELPASWKDRLQKMLPSQSSTL